MEQNAKDYILNKYGEETLKGVENGDLSKDKFEEIIKKWKEIIPDNLTLGEMPDMMKSDLIQTIPNDDKKIENYQSHPAIKAPLSN